MNNKLRFVQIIKKLDGLRSMGLKKSKLFLWLISFWAVLIAVTAQNPQKSVQPPALPSLLKTGEPVTGTPLLIATDTAGRNFMSQAQAYIANGRFQEAKEALRTAIRLEPMNLEAWALYDYLVEINYIGRAREEKLNPSIDMDIKPNFNIVRAESYMEYGNLYIIGEVKNISSEVRRRVELTGILFDENKQELRRQTTYLSLSDRGIFPGESRLFEIMFRSPPPGMKSFRVKITNYE